MWVKTRSPKIHFDVLGKQTKKLKICDITVSIMLPVALTGAIGISTKPFNGHVLFTYKHVNANLVQSNIACYIISIVYISPTQSENLDTPTLFVVSSLKKIKLERILHNIFGHITHYAILYNHLLYQYPHAFLVSLKNGWQKRCDAKLVWLL